MGLYWDVLLLMRVVQRAKKGERGAKPKRESVSKINKQTPSLNCRNLFQMADALLQSTMYSRCRIYGRRSPQEIEALTRKMEWFV